MILTLILYNKLRPSHLYYPWLITAIWYTLDHLTILEYIAEVKLSIEKRVSRAIKMMIYNTYSSKMHRLPISFFTSLMFVNFVLNELVIHGMKANGHPPYSCFMVLLA